MKNLIFFFKFSALFMANFWRILPPGSASSMQIRIQFSHNADPDPHHLFQSSIPSSAPQAYRKKCDVFFLVQTPIWIVMPICERKFF